MPGQGEVVKYGSVIGMVGKCTPSEYTLCAYLGQNQQLILKDMVVLPHKLIHATQEDVKALKALMFDSGVVYSVKMGMFVDVCVPDNGDFVVVRHSKTTKHGIFDRVESGTYVFYYLDNQENDVCATSIPIDECEIARASSKDGMELLETLARIGVMWSAKDKRFLPVPMKAELGGKYWYINDKFYICQVKDLQTPVHRERYKNGNYFTSYAEALVFLNRLKDLRMELNKGLDL